MTTMERSSRVGYLRWCLAQGVERVTVHHLAALSSRRVSDVRFILSCEGIPSDFRTATVSIHDLLGRWPDG